MGIYSEKQREQISIEVLNSMLRIATRGKVQSYISENDKEPMWDGYIYVYKESGSEKSSDFLFRIPVQVKSKEVNKFSNQFISFPIPKTCLNGYLNDGGIIYFVVEIKVDDNGKYETKIFYKLLIPSELKKILDNMDENSKSKNIHINRILNDRDNFLTSCTYFEEARKIQSIDSINNSISLEKVLDKEIKVVAVNGLKDILKGDFFTYCVNEHNIKMPVKFEGIFNEISMPINNIINIDETRYFCNCTRHMNSKNEEYITFGDTIKVLSNKKITILASTNNILERHKTLEYFLNNLLIEGVKITKKEKQGIETLKNEKKFIEDVLKVCDRFNIDCTTVKLKDFKETDFNAVNLLLSVKEYNGFTNGVRNVEFTIVSFLKYKIALLKTISDNDVFYYDLYSEKINICIVSKYKDKQADLSRFVVANENILISYNFNSEVVIKSLLPINPDVADISSENYNKMMLFLIKAWDIDRKNEYIILIRELENILKGYIDEDIEIINKAQVEYRLNNKKLSHETRNKLYKIKFKENIDENIVCAIYILLEDYKGFEDNFKLLGSKEKEIFKEYPIYTLYKDKHKRE